MFKATIILALAACVLAVAASPMPEVDEEQTELAMFESDQVETAALKGDYRIFADFCLSIRDQTQIYLKEKTNENVFHVFNKVMEVIGDMIDSVRKSNEVAAEEAAKIIKDDALQVKRALGGVIGATAGTGKEKAMNALEDLRQMITQQNLIESLNKACESFNYKFKSKVESQLASFKSAHLKQSDKQDYRSLISGVRLGNLGCVTTSRITKITLGCGIYMTILPTVRELFGN